MLFRSFLKPSITNEWMKRYWYALRIPAWLRKQACQFFFSNSPFPASANDVKSIVRIDTPISINRKSSDKRITEAALILVDNPLLLEETANRFPELKDKMMVAPFGCEPTHTLPTFEEKNELREKLTEGMDYFLCIYNSSDTHDLLVMLKAFSIFKKWQRSQMKFMLAVDDKIKPWLMSKLETYKFRSDVVITTDMNELNDIMASA